MNKFFKVSTLEKNLTNLRKSYVTMTWVEWDETEVERSGVVCLGKNGRFFLNCGKDASVFVPADFPADRVTCVRFNQVDHFPK
jgi:hypothetical protein